MEKRRAIPPNPPRWQPNSDPSSIHVPGLDTSASITDQIEQMEQQITIKLQNIDENFSKIHHLLANKLLPAVKRYAVGTEPVREAAKFWTSFYEQAAQIRIPTYDDYSTVNDPSEHAEASEVHEQPRTQVSQSQIYDSSMVSTESSFMPGQAAFSSTPATARVAVSNNTFNNQHSDDLSWNDSMESPLVRLDREIQRFSKEEEEEDNILRPSTSNQISSLQLDEPTPNPRYRDRSVRPSSEKGKGKEGGEPLLRNVLRHNLHSMSDTSSTVFSNVSPLKYRGKPKTPIPKKYNPYLPPDTDPADWSGVVDLRDPSITTPQRRRGLPSSRRTPTTPARELDDEESFDGLPPGMSPPVMMSPARPPRSSAELGLKLMQTPGKEASARIARDLIFYGKDARGRGHGNSGVESSMSTIPSPPSLSRYRHGSDTTDSLVLDSSLESMMQRVGLHVPQSVGTASTPGLRLRSHGTTSYASDPYVNLQPTGTVFNQPMTPDHPADYSDMDSDMDSLDEMDAANPSAPFFMAPTRDHDDSDDSFGSSDSLNEEQINMGLAPVHNFVQNVEDDGFGDDSFSDDDMYDNGGMVQEETLFGVPPQVRMQGSQGRLQSGGHHGEGLRMLGGDLLEDTMGISDQIAMSGRVEESPTPASWAASSIGRN